MINFLALIVLLVLAIAVLGAALPAPNNQPKPTARKVHRVPTLAEQHAHEAACAARRLSRLSL